MEKIKEAYNQKPNEYYTSSRQDMISFIPKTTKTLVDVGCGEGYFAKAFKDIANAQVHGVEMNPISAAKASKILDKVYIGDIDSQLANLPDNFYDAITCNDVLEHLFDPYQTLKNLTAKLTSEGVIIASIPNFRFFRNLIDILYKKDWEYKSSGILDFTHLRFFTQKSIIRMFEEAGYEIIKCQGITKSKSLRPYIYNFLTLGAFGKDSFFLHFAVVAKKLRD